MACIINASTSAGLVQSADTSGELQLQNNGTTVATINSSGLTSTTTAKAWVRFSGVTSTTILASYNVSSVTYNGAGDYTANFTNAFADANYCAIGSVGVASSRNVMITWNTLSAGSLRMITYSQTAAANTDQTGVHVAIFR